MKGVFIAIVLLLQTLSVWGQGNMMEMECGYRLTFVKDTIENVSAEEIMLLRLGQGKSVFFSENKYRRDSLMNSSQREAISRDILANGLKRYPKSVVQYYVLKDFTARKLTFADNFGLDYMQYEEAMPVFDWKLTQQRKTIGGYTCQKATCTYRGRTYEAWFAPEIPINNGPWKFHGLPGLIMEVADTRNHYKFEFLYMTQHRTNMGLPREYTPTTREKYMKVLTRYLKDPVGYVTSTMNIEVSAVGGSKAKSKAQRYAPMELK